MLTMETGALGNEECFGYVFNAYTGPPKPEATNAALTKLGSNQNKQIFLPKYGEKK